MRHCHGSGTGHFLECGVTISAIATENKQEAASNCKPHMPAIDVHMFSTVKLAAAACLLTLISCSEAPPHDMTGSEFCAYVVDPLYASRSRVRLEELDAGDYLFTVFRPGSRIRVRVGRHELEVKSGVEHKPLPVYVPFDTLRVVGNETKPANCSAWFP